MAERDSLSIVICGEAGQGIQTIEAFLTRMFQNAGYSIFACKEYMSRIRGGSNSTEIRVSARPVAAYARLIDMLIPLDGQAIPHLAGRIIKDTWILGETEKIAPPEGMTVTDVPFTKIATELGNPIFANIVACGVIAGVFGFEPALIEGTVRAYFGSKAPEIIEKNTQAAEAGRRLGTELPKDGRLGLKRPDMMNDPDLINVNGAEAVAMGALAGGCNFIASYPMSPGTGVLTYLAQYSAKFPILVEQAEDEIAAINMALGAWYAGARAIVTTSGGGFALMTEGISLAGMIESPVVVHIAQRPGPATGLPTRTEQADLELALYAGHGEFPRIILAPGNHSEAFYLAQQAFQLADRFQVPVFLLTDQYLVDSYSSVPTFELQKSEYKPAIVETAPDYRRYERTETGVSPRGVPGYGDGLVGVDSDEHDEEGHIAEDPEIRVQMNRKRLGKLELIKEAVIPPELIGGPDYRVLVVGWGSTLETLKEAATLLDRDNLAVLHLKQVYPLPVEVETYLRKADRVIVVENNAGSQLAKLIRQTTGVEIRDRILKYDGMPFAVEELVEQLNAILGEGMK